MAGVGTASSPAIGVGLAAYKCARFEKRSSMLSHSFSAPIIILLEKSLIVIIFDGEQRSNRRHLAGNGFDEK